VERVLTDINADYGDCGIELLRHGVLLVFGAPGQLKTLAGQEHGRTIPLTDTLKRGQVGPKVCKLCVSKTSSNSLEFAGLRWITLACLEKVSFEFLSLRQSFGVQHSPWAYERA
jgi:hypothetical protein